MAATVAFAGTRSYLQGEQWSLFMPALQEQLPLRNLHWKSASRPSIRTIQLLDLVFIPHNDIVGLSLPRAHLLLEAPLLNVYIASCEDAETYKTVKKEIQDWHSVVAARKDQEWLILLVLPPESAFAAKKRFQMKSSILDKLRADFNGDKRDRCAQLAWSTSAGDPTIWADFVSKMKDGIVSAVDSYVTMREEEFRSILVRGEVLDFPLFCLYKNALATSFEIINLLDDAKIQLDELEMAALQHMQDDGKHLFSSFGGTALRDDSTPLLALHKKNYRAMLQLQTMTVFDFREYLCASQWVLQCKLNDYIGAVDKVTAFIPAFARSMRQEDLGSYFVESWIYAASLNVIEQVQLWPSDVIAMNNLSRHKATLYDLARSQLDVLGIAFNYLRPEFPFSLSAHIPSPVKSSSATSVTQKDLLAAISDQDTFDKLYMMVTNRAIEYATASGRKRLGLRLHACLAALDRDRKRFKSAHNTFSSLPAHYAGAQWTALQAQMAGSSLVIHSNALMDIDEGWIRSALQFIQIFVELGSDPGGRELSWASSFNNGAAQESLEQLTQRVVDILMHHPTLAADNPIFTNPMMTIDSRVPGFSTTSPEDEESSIVIAITNRLPWIITPNTIRLELSKPPGNSIVYTCENVELHHGKNSVKLTMPVSTPGVYEVRRLDVIFNAFTLRYHLNDGIRAKRSVLHTVFTRKNSEVVTIDAKLPRSIEVGQLPVLEFHISSGSLSIRQLSFVVQDPSGRISFPKAEHSRPQQGADAGAGSAGLTYLNANSSTVITLTCQGSLQGAPIVLQLNGEYLTSEDAQGVHRFKKECIISGALPLVVNVQDVFRGDRLFSRFTISSDGRAHVRILAAELTTGPESPQIPIVSNSFIEDIVCPTSTLSVLMQIDISQAKLLDFGGSLLFSLHYRTLREEISLRIERAMAERTARTTNGPMIRLLQRSTFRILDLSPEWEAIYANTSTVVLAIPPNGFSRIDILSQAFDETFGVQDDSAVRLEAINETLSALDEIEKVLKSPMQSNISRNLPFRRLILPLDLPRINVINAVSFELLHTEPIYAGQPVDAVVHISTTFHGTLPQCAMQYELNSNELNSWLISGHSRGQFEARDGAKFSAKLTLIPLRHGELNLPIVSVYPFTTGNVQTSLLNETYQERMAERISVLPRGQRTTWQVTVPLREMFRGDD